jgi:hypothetical protein
MGARRKEEKSPYNQPHCHPSPVVEEIYECVMAKKARWALNDSS